MNPLKRKSDVIIILVVMITLFLFFLFNANSRMKQIEYLLDIKFNQQRQEISSLFEGTPFIIKFEDINYEN